MILSSYHNIYTYGTVSYRILSAVRYGIASTCPTRKPTRRWQAEEDQAGDVAEGAGRGTGCGGGRGTRTAGVVIAPVALQREAAYRRRRAHRSGYGGSDGFL